MRRRPSDDIYVDPLADVSLAMHKALILTRMSKGFPGLSTIAQKAVDEALARTEEICLQDKQTRCDGSVIFFIAKWMLLLVTVFPFRLLECGIKKVFGKKHPKFVSLGSGGGYFKPPGFDARMKRIRKNRGF